MGWIGLIVGFIMGALCMSILICSKREPLCGIDFCEKCKSEICGACDKWQNARLDVKALDEKCQSLKRSIYQLRGENCRLQGKLWYQFRVGVAR